MLGGNLACGVTHTSIVTLDLIKCQLQINPSLYNSLWDGINKIYWKEGFNGLIKGYQPTFIGYSF